MEKPDRKPADCPFCKRSVFRTSALGYPMVKHADDSQCILRKQEFLLELWPAAPHQEEGACAHGTDFGMDCLECENGEPSTPNEAQDCYGRPLAVQKAEGCKCFASGQILMTGECPVHGEADEDGGMTQVTPNEGCAT